jgi:hypothetical protein
MLYQLLTCFPALLAHDMLIMLTPESAAHPSEPPAAFRFADGVLDVKRERFICIREDHSSAAGNAAKVVNSVRLTCFLLAADMLC